MDMLPMSALNRERWNVAQVKKHESLFSFSDNLTTWMFIVASDVIEAQRERLTSSLSLKGMNTTTSTFQALRTTFLVLFCTPKSSMENPSLRVSGLVSSMNRMCIVDDYAEDDFGHLAK